MGTATRRLQISVWRERSRDILHRLFPERQLLLRTGGRASFIRFSRRAQIMLVAVLVLAGTWSAFTSVSYMLHYQVLALKDNQIASGRLAYRSLLHEVSEYQKKIASITLDLEENHALMLHLVERNAALQQNLTDRAVAYIESMEKVVRLTGLTADQLLEADTGLPRGQGGPFIEAERDALPADRLKANLSTLDARLQHSKALEAVMRKLPLTAPLDFFYITSSFGKRRDPINRRWASHYGLDMGGALRSPVYVTAPGVVTFVGWNGKYGKVIEVDHGAGIKTRYGHLHKTLVKKGQKVKFRQKIGVLGNTGRSTGAHLHYEVLFQRKAKDPMKFIKAGRHVFQE